MSMTIRLTYFVILTENKGKTLHLLKASSKPVPQERKRKKIEILGSFNQFKDQLEEHKQEESEAESRRS